MNPFTDHPRSIGETYCQHSKNAISFGVKMIVGGIACLVHSIFPFLFKCTGSSICKKLNDEMSKRNVAP